MISTLHQDELGKGETMHKLLALIVHYWEVLYVFPLLFVIASVMMYFGDGAAGVLMFISIPGTLVWITVVLTIKKR